MQKYVKIHKKCHKHETSRGTKRRFEELTMTIPLQKHAYSNILKILQPKIGKFSNKKNLIFFHISAQNIGGSNEYPQSMFSAK